MIKRTRKPLERLKHIKTYMGIDIYIDPHYGSILCFFADDIYLYCKTLKEIEHQIRKLSKHDWQALVVVDLHNTKYTIQTAFFDGEDWYKFGSFDYDYYCDRFVPSNGHLALYDEDILKQYDVLQDTYEALETEQHKIIQQQEALLRSLKKAT